MLSGQLVDLNVVERDDLVMVARWYNDLDFVGEFEPFHQGSLADTERQFAEKKDSDWFIVSSKDGEPVGFACAFKVQGAYGIGYMLVPEARGRGYGSEAVRILVDYVFLHHDVPRVQAETHPDNTASQRVLEKAGFRKEGILRAKFFSRGVWRHTAMWSIIREDWGGPSILPRGHLGQGSISERPK
jgi:RimJ/RimL family protein N-acetyltransferase